MALSNTAWGIISIAVAIVLALVTALIKRVRRRRRQTRPDVEIRMMVHERCTSQSQSAAHVSASPLPPQPAMVRSAAQQRRSPCPRPPVSIVTGEVGAHFASTTPTCTERCSTGSSTAAPSITEPAGIPCLKTASMSSTTLPTST